MKIEAYMNVDPQGGAIFFRTNVSHVATIPLVSAYELQAAQAREAKLREAILDATPLVAKALAAYNDDDSQRWYDKWVQKTALPADDSALMERLKQEREHTLERVAGFFDSVKDRVNADAIRGLA